MGLGSLGLLLVAASAFCSVNLEPAGGDPREDPGARQSRLSMEARDPSCPGPMLGRDAIIADLVCDSTRQATTTHSGFGPARRGQEGDRLTKRSFRWLEHRYWPGIAGVIAGVALLVAMLAWRVPVGLPGTNQGEPNNHSHIHIHTHVRSDAPTTPSPPIDTSAASLPVPLSTPQSGMPQTPGEAAERFGGKASWWEQPWPSRPRVWSYQDYQDQIPLSFVVPQSTFVSVCGVPANPEPSSCDIDHPPYSYSAGQRVYSNWFTSPGGSCREACSTSHRAARVRPALASTCGRSSCTTICPFRCTAASRHGRQPAL
jgi:hypothetical protein